MVFLFRLIFVIFLGNLLDGVVKLFVTGEKLYRKLILQQEVPEDIED